VLPSVRDYPRAPWWETDDRPLASLNPTAAVAGLLHKWKVQHRWRDPATAFCWRKIDEQAEIGGYEMRSVLTFLECVPDRQRAASVFEEFGKRILQRGIVALDPDEPGEVFKPRGCQRDRKMRGGRAEYGCDRKRCGTDGLGRVILSSWITSRQNSKNRAQRAPLLAGQMAGGNGSYGFGRYGKAL